MRRVFWLVLLCAGLLYGGDVSVGQRVYLQMIAPVSGENADLFAARHTRAEWEVIMRGDGAAFVQKLTAEFPDLKGYFEGEFFGRHLPHLRAYLIEWASDSGNFKGCCVG